MRAFLAVDLGATLGPAAHEWGRAVSRTLGSKLAAGLSWVAAERVHVTLRFFGSITPARAEAIVAALAPMPPPAAFDLTLAGAGTFPEHGRPRVLWLGFSRGAQDLVRAYEWSRERLAGVVDEDRRDGFSPHLTVARVRRDTSPGLGAALRGAAARTPRPEGQARVDAITLFESVLSPKGPTYVPLVRFPLD